MDHAEEKRLRLVLNMKLVHVRTECFRVTLEYRSENLLVLAERPYS